MNGITINPGTATTVPGLNKYELLESESSEVKALYKEVFDKVQGSLTTSLDNDTLSKFEIAANKVAITDIQLEIFNHFKAAFVIVQKKIDPARLNFTIRSTTDDEIYISRVSDCGVSNLIIHDDGLISFSFISYAGTGKQDILEFYEENPDYELITYKFLS